MKMNGGKIDTMKSLNSSDCNKDEKEVSMELHPVSERKKVLNGQRYKKLLKSRGIKSMASEPSIQRKEISRKANVTEASGSNKDETTNAENSGSCSQEERLDFLLRRVRSSGHAQGSKSSDDIVQAKKRKKNISEIPCISKPEEKLANLVPDECKSTKINFVEYWVPVRLSNVQIEQYCGSLFSNSSLLCSSSKNDSVGILPDILISIRKCCDHPYLMNPSLRASLIEGIPVPEQMDAEIKLSNKLVLLHKILTEIKKQGLRVLILYQTLGGSGPISIGDILDDIIHQKFGADSFLRIDGWLSRSKRRAVLHTFNHRRSDHFVCLMETHACVPSMKLSSIDTVIFFNSDWDPINDLRTLQKMSLNSRFERVKVFRLYSPHTVEEKVLILAKQGLNLESNMINIKRSTRHGLISWGANYLFEKLDEYHNLSSQAADLVTCGDSFLDDVFLEFSALLPNKGHSDSSKDNSLIMEAKATEGIYPRNIVLLGELDYSEEMIDREPSYVFWTKLLEGRNPRWRYFSSQSPRTRKVVHCVPHLSEAFAEKEIASKESGKEVESRSQIHSICRRRRIRTKLQDKKRKLSDLCQDGRKHCKRSRKAKCISRVADRRESMASWIHRQSKAATLARAQTQMSPMEHDHLPESTTLQDGQAHCTTSPNFHAQATIDPLAEPSVRQTENGIGPNNASHANVPHNFQVMCSQALQSVCKTLETELESLQKEKTQKLKLHEDMILQTKMACEKEIDEIRKKYDLVLHNSEVAFLKENELLDSRYRKVCANKALAEVMVLKKSQTTPNPSPVAEDSSVEETHQQISQLTGQTTVTRHEQLSSNSLPGYSIIQMLNQAPSPSLTIPLRPNQPANSREVAICPPSIGQSLEIANISSTSYRFDQSTSSQLVALDGMMVHHLGNFQGGYTVRAPAPHMLHMRSPWQLTSPKISPHSSPGVIFSPINLPKVTSRKKQSPQLLYYLSGDPYDN